MRVGFSVPQLGAAAVQVADVSRFAREAEALGAHSLWVGDRLLAPVDPVVGYPPGASTIPEEFDRIADPFALLTAAAIATEQVLVGTNVLNAPWYPPALLARSLTTIDQLSRGRLVPGFGVGWSPDEFRAAGIPMRERGARLDESLQALKELWTSPTAEFDGHYWSFPASRVHLKPVQRPRPPLYVGGFSTASFHRVAKHGDGWLPIISVRRDVDLASAVTEPWNHIRSLAAGYNREPHEIDAILRVYPDSEATLANVVDTVRRVEAETPIHHALVDLMFLSADIDHTLDMIGNILSAI